MSDWNTEKIHDIVEAQREYFLSGKTLEVNWRIEQLMKLKTAMYEHEEELKAALAADLGRSEAEAFFCDIGTVILEINETIRGLRRWSRPETHFSGLVCFPSLFTKVYHMPYGVSLIISPFNFPVLLSLGVLIASIAGGNTTVIKTSSKSTACTEATARLIADIFPPEYVTVVDGGHDVADMCLAERFDKIFYTGSPRVGSHVLEMAARNLTPVALELGGETGNWAIVRSDADIADAARKIAFFKLCNSGQVCININQVAVAEDIAGLFTDALIAEFRRQIGDALTNPEYPHLVNHGAYNKCASEADQYRDRIINGGHGDPDTLKYEPTVISPVRIDEDIVRHELFCPLLPIVPFKDDDIDRLLGIIARREHGLALYLFTKDIKWASRTMQTQQFGGGCINEVCVHMMVRGVPFNGTGHSGMGAYHGKWGFREFTHPCSVLRGSTHFNLSLREHPYTKRKLKLIRSFEK